MPIDWAGRTAGAAATEPVRRDGRLTIWAPAPSSPGAGLWDRVTVDLPRASRDGGFWSAPATAFRVRRRPPDGLIRRLASKLTGVDGGWSLPDGTPVERTGGRRVDLVVAWSDDPDGLDEGLARTRRPDFIAARRIGAGVFLLEGVGVDGASRASDPPRAEKPAEAADRLIELARRSGDRRAEASALADRGALLAGADDAAAAQLFHAAAAVFRDLGDPAREADALGGLGLALTNSGRPREALGALEAAFGLAERAGDAYARKLVLERIALARSHLRDPAGALAALDDALRSARPLGDRHQEYRLLWMQAIALAELGRRDEAAARADESTALMRSLGRPEAAWYEEQLRRYREEGSIFNPAFYLGGPTAARPEESGPGLLRMAFSATKAMAAFIGSGLKTTPEDARRLRLSACRSCEHHTGLRCRVCGCFTEAKSRMAHERCPLGKWPE